MNGNAIVSFWTPVITAYVNGPCC